MPKRLLIYLLIILGLAQSGLTAANYSSPNQTGMSDSLKTAMYILNVIRSTTWPNQKSITNFSIDVLSKSSYMVDLLDSLAKTNNINGIPYTVNHYRKVRSLSSSTHVLIILRDSQSDVDDLFPDASNNHILLITDRYTKRDFTMVNFWIYDKSQQKQFEVNTDNVTKAGLSVSKQLLVYGGSEVDLRGLYADTDRKLKAEREELDRQRAILDSQIAINQVQTNEIAKQRKEIQEHQLQIAQQKRDLLDAMSEMDYKQTKLDSSRFMLTVQEIAMLEQEERLNEQQDLVSIQDSQLQTQIQELELQKQEITEQKSTLGTYAATIETQQFMLYTSVLILLLIAAMVIMIWLGYRGKKRANQQLANQNAAILQQKEEIMVQAQKMENLNTELEKLSIVASETQSAVTIMNVDGSFEWVNMGFTRMYGYSLQLLLNQKDGNLRGISSREDIDEILQQCIETKQSVVYESHNETRDHKGIWTQCTLTPILSDNNEVIKLISVDSDITFIKEAEEEIRKQHEQITLQANLLESSNKELEKLSIVASKTDNAVLITDAKGNFEWVNEGYERMFGYNLQELITKISPNIISEKTPEQIRTYIEKAIADKKTVSYEFASWTKSGNKIWAQTTLTPIVNENGDIYKLIAIDSDISKMKQAEAEIIQQSEEIMAQKEAMSQQNEEILAQKELVEEQYDEITAQRDKLEMQNNDIRGSIRYAKTIQSAILPIQEQIEVVLKNFIIYRPKDIVSGDFYWFNHLPTKDGIERALIAVVDCTGHGVPGAFMSMIGSRLLSEIVNEKKIHSPALILEHMDTTIREALRQSQSDNTDGMDVCFCLVEKTSDLERRVVFSGAKRPLFWYDMSESVLNSEKGTRRAIGGVKSRGSAQEFEEIELILTAGDMIYLSSDGMIDQNRPDRKRFGTPRFTEMVHKTAHLPLKKQKIFFEETFDEFRMNEEQRDDITIIGLRV